MPLSFPNWKFPVLNYLLGTSKKSNEGIKKEGRSSSPAPTLSSSGSSNTLTSSSSDPDLSRHSITVEEPHRESSATAMRPSSPSLWEDAPPDFTRSTISIHQGRETFTLPHDPHSWYVHDPRRSTVTRYDKIDDGYGFKGEEIPENKFREKIITAVPLNDSSYRSSLSSRTSTRSQSPKIAVPSKKITLAEEGKARAREIVETEINSLSEEDHQKIRELVKPGTRLHVARFYLMGNFLEKLETEEMKKKYPELKNKDFRQAVAKKMASEAIETEQKRQSEVRLSSMKKKQEETSRSSLLGRVSSAFTSRKSK